MPADLGNLMDQLEQEPRDAEAGKAIVGKVLALPGFAAAHGFEILSVEPGAVTLAVNGRADLMQFHYNFHGGAIAALADQAAAAAANTVLPEGQVAATVELKLNHLRAATGYRLYAIARVRHTGGNTVAVEVRIECEGTGGRGPVAAGLITLRPVPFIG